MRHRKNIKRLSRQSAHRKAVLRNQVKSFIVKEKIKTTLMLAKESRRLAEKLITLGKRNTLAARRQAFDVLGDRNLVKLLFTEIAPRFINRAGGYTRIVHLGKRRGDNAALVVLELTEQKSPEEKSKKQKKEKIIKTAEVKNETKSPKTENASAEAEEKATTKTKGKGKDKSKDKDKPKDKDLHPQEKDKKFLGGLRKFLKQDKAE
ncbi:MAG: 50S ribosomal protein L17 [Candidatus Omnitrophota bacterium]